MRISGSVCLTAVYAGCSELQSQSKQTSDYQLELINISETEKQYMISILGKKKQLLGSSWESLVDMEKVVKGSEGNTYNRKEFEISLETYPDYKISVKTSESSAEAEITKKEFQFGIVIASKPEGSLDIFISK